MEGGRKYEDAEARAFIAQMTEDERRSGFRRQLEKLAAKWQQPFRTYEDGYDDGFADGQRHMIDGGGP